METIKKILLRQNDYDTGIIEELKAAVQVLTGLNEVEVGLMPFVKINDQFILEEDFTKHSILGKNWRAEDPASMATFQMYMGFLAERHEPMPISNLTEEVMDFAPFMRPVFDSGARSYITYPMQNSDGLSGSWNVVACGKSSYA